MFGYIGGTPNYLLVYHLEIPIVNPFGNYAVILFGLATAYIIFRYRFLEIEVIVKRKRNHRLFDRSNPHRELEALIKYAKSPVASTSGEKSTGNAQICMVRES